MSVKKQYLKTKPECKVTFGLKSNQLPEDSIVYLAADFNNWDIKALPMKKGKDGSYSVTVNLPSGAEYQYRYFANNYLWINDEAADKYVPNNIDGENSVVVL